MPRIGPEASDIQRLVVLLEKASRRRRAPIWRRLAALLKRPRRKQRVLNLYKIAKYSKPGAVIATPCKICAVGELGHSVHIACPRISKAAAEKIAAAGGKVLTFEELVASNPRGSGVLLLVG